MVQGVDFLFLIVELFLPLVGCALAIGGGGRSGIDGGRFGGLRRGIAGWLRTDHTHIFAGREIVVIEVAGGRTRLGFVLADGSRVIPERLGGGAADRQADDPQQEQSSHSHAFYVLHVIILSQARDFARGLPSLNRTQYQYPVLSTQYPVHIGTATGDRVLTTNN